MSAISSTGLTKTDLLFFAILFNESTSIREYLIGPNSANLNAVMFGKTHLHMAIEKADYIAINMLLRSKADVEEVCRGVTPLELAISLGSSISVKALLNAKADPNAKNSNGTSMLELAESVEQPMDRMVIIESIKQAQIYMAVEKADYKGIDILLKAKTDLNGICRGVTPLELAISLGNIISVRALLNAKADPYAKNSNGTSMLELAESVKSKYHSKVIIEFIKKAQRELLEAEEKKS